MTPNKEHQSFTCSETGRLAWQKLISRHKFAGPNKTIILAFFLSLLATTGLLEVKAQSSVPKFWPGVACWPASYVDGILQNEHEQPIGHGKTANGKLTIWATKDGSSFSVVADWGDDKAYRCIIAQGKEFSLDESKVNQLLLKEKSRGI